MLSSNTAIATHSRGLIILSGENDNGSMAAKIAPPWIPDIKAIVSFEIAFVSGSMHFSVMHFSVMHFSVEMHKFRSPR
ncbi:MAG: hypothetical protein IGR92_11785 [Leptolyngbyaceae cyanobacterium T60_A2020_046]|nr:hypothetical protein [Leptolyngbyaceae cyanobacterium T60_A2020_046]